MKISLTYCNPLPLPNYQRGRHSIGEEKEKDFGWLNEIRRDFREMADPTVIKFKDKWYLFPSAGMLWYSDDMVNWTYHPIEPFDPGYAPTVVEKDGYLYLTACWAGMWRATNPLGEWEYLGDIKNEKGEKVDWYDPMLFVDDDGSMYCYNGLGADGIYVAKLKDDDYTTFDGPKVNLFAFNPEHIWERYGELNQNPDKSYVEGAWMTKYNGKYYLQYSAPGTDLKCYSVGCYVSDHPMKDFKYQEINPILREKGGLVNGVAHHSMVEGPNGTMWCFYTTLVRIEHFFERRIGMDPVGFDDNGNMFVAGPTETPQLAPGIAKKPEKCNDAGLMLLSYNCLVRASSYEQGHETTYAVDNYIRTWWQAKEDDENAYILIDLDREYEVYSARTMFADRGLDYDNGVVPAPYKYKILGSKNGEIFKVLFDASKNKEDKHIAYDTFEPALIQYIKLEILEAPKGMSKAVWEFSVFGKV